MEYIGFSWYRWLKFKYLVKEKTKLNLEKDSDSAINKEYKFVLKGEIWSQKQGEMDWIIGFYFTGTSKILFSAQITQIWIIAPQKPHISTQFEDIYRLVHDLTIFEEKKILTFLTKAGTLTTKIGQIIFPSVLVKSRTNR
jgi:hypothetical protein